MPSTVSRREELLGIAAGLFASKGFRNTTVRDIADAAGILSGSLYHHFDSKESMVDEILRTFQDELFGRYDEILASDDDPRAKLEQAVRVSFDTRTACSSLARGSSSLARIKLEQAVRVSFDAI